MNKNINKTIFAILIILMFYIGQITFRKYGYGCIEGNCKNGYGTIREKNGGIIKGNFVNEKLNGYGEMTWGKGMFEGDAIKGNFVNGIAKGEATLYKSALDATFVGIFKDHIESKKLNLHPTGYFKVYFGENSIWQGTFEGEFVNGTSKEWEERISIRNSKDGKFVAKNAGLFLSALFCYSQEKAILDCFDPLMKIFKKDLTKEPVSDIEIQEVSDSLTSQKLKLLQSLNKLNQLEDFDHALPLKAVLVEKYSLMIKYIEDYAPTILKILKQNPSKDKPLHIANYMKPYSEKFKKLRTEYSNIYTSFQNNYTNE